jgi:HAD superfamily hydrolase (TIGR01549 family)
MDTWIVGQKSPAAICEYLLDNGEQIENQVFCFDYFDTLVVRDIQPEYTKQLAAVLHARIFTVQLSPQELYALRQEIEKQLCRENVAAGGELEFYLTDFATSYYHNLRSKKGESLNGISEERFRQIVLDIEIAVELAVQHPCAESIELLQDLKRRGKITVLVSDFYIPGSHFKKLLKHFELLDLFDHMYISSDHRLAKGSGRMYAKICDDLCCRPEQIMMIGDNPHADVAMAREHGCRAIHLQNPARQAFYGSWQSQDMSGIERVAERFSAVIPEHGPFREMASTLCFFTSLLLDELIKRKVRHVFFFSKEGEFLKKLFDQLQRDIFGTVVVSSHYLLVSRKATFLASLRPLEQEDFSRLFAHYRDISLRDFLLSLNIEESVAATLCSDLQLDFQTRIFDLQTNPEFEKLLQAESFQQEYERRRGQQRENLVKYLDSFGVDYRQDGLTVVDVGWKGSIQDNVYHILQGKVSVQGFFLGSLIATEKKENNRKKGLLFDDSPEPSPFFHVFNNNRSLFEMMLGASHGSADGYFTRSQYEQLPAGHQRVVQQTFSAGGDEICVTTLDFPEERELYQQAIEPLQEQILQAAAFFNRAYIRSGCTLPDPAWFARQHARMVFTPSKQEVDFFEQLYHLENFGIFEYTNFLAGKKLSLKQRLKNLKNILKDPAILETGFWPPIILRRLGLDLYRHVDGRKRLSREFPVTDRKQEKNGQG